MQARSMVRPRWRGVAAVVLVVVGTVSLTSALLVGWAQRTVFDDREFADRTIRVLDSGVVRRALAEEITDQIIENGSTSLASYRTAIVGVVEDVVATSGFRMIFRGALIQAHRAVFQRNGAAALLELGETLKLLSENAHASKASFASELPSGAGSLLIDVTPTVRRLDLWRFANDVRWLDEVSMVVAIVALAGAVALDRSRRTVMLVALAVVVAGVLVVLTADVIPDVAVRTIDDPSLADAIASGVGHFVGDLRSLGLWVVPLGLVFLAATHASETTDRIRVGMALDRFRRRPVLDRSPAAQFGIGAATVALGLLVVVWRDGIIPFLLLLAGGLVVYRGTVLVVRALLGPAPPPELGHARRPLPRRIVMGTAVGVVVVLLAGALVDRVATASSAAGERGELRCNGSTELCDRRLDQVAFAGSHNSMSAEADPGWLFAENLHGIPAQLQYGIRAFLVKTHYGIAANIEIAGVPLVVTDKAAEIAQNRFQEESELGADAVATVQQIAASVGPVSGKPEIYLCHGYCELGATKFSTTLDAMRQFMNRNPDQVLIMIIGDFVRPEDTADAFRKAGLIDRVWTYDLKKKPPTLREMIDQRRTLLVLAEHDGGRPAWYGQAYGPNGVFQDTPFTFATPADFSCAPNRGTPQSPLFQINHWITNKKPPSPEQARTVNSFRNLSRWVERCERQRKHFPTVIGVNFYDIGGLLRVVNDLNARGPR
jgi:uncharacterized membrane protein YdcZ (DUF606 family)